jgi:hypothetical protein
MVAAAKAIAVAVTRPPATVLYTSRTLRQVSEFMKMARALYTNLRTPVESGSYTISPLDTDQKLTEPDWATLPAASRDTVLELALENGSRIVGIPSREETVRGFSAITLLIVDEASRVPDDFFAQCGAYLAVSKGSTLALSTPFGQRGWFWNLFAGMGSMDCDWQRIRITASGCEHADHMCEPCKAVSTVRITDQWLAAERRRIGERWWMQEYMADFSEAAGAVFSGASIRQAAEAGRHFQRLEGNW